MCEGFFFSLAHREFFNGKRLKRRGTLLAGVDFF